MMRVINVLTDSESQGASDEHVREIVFAAGEACDADGARDTVSSDLHQASIVIFVRDHCRDGPCLRAVSGRKRGSAIEKLAAFDAVGRSRTLADTF